MEFVNSDKQLAKRLYFGSTVQKNRMNLSSYQPHKRMKKHAKKRKTKKIYNQHADQKARKEGLMICSYLGIGWNLHLNDFEVFLLAG